MRECVISKLNECLGDDTNTRHARSTQMSNLLYYVETGFCNDGGLSLQNPR